MTDIPEFSKEIWKDNYRAPGENTIEETWKRLAVATAAIEDESIRSKIEDDFYSILKDFKFVPGGRIMANLGVPGREATTLFNCYVKDADREDADSIEGIFDELKAQACTLRSEGGYGTNFSYIRPRGMYVRGIGSRTPGVLKFMELWDKSSEIITMGSDYLIDELREGEKIKIRKGAMMGVLSVWHPEILDFIKAKLIPGRLTKFNLSVGITDGFMNAVLLDEDWNLVFPDLTNPQYESVWKGDIEDWKSRQLPIKIYKTIKARDLWKLIIESTYKRNDPGVLFLDLANKLNPLYYAETVSASNPCGEILMATGVCNLGSLNLTRFVKKGPNGWYFDFKEYEKHVEIAVRYLDNINSISRTPLPEYQQALLEKRRIGLGNMGLGSVCVMLGMRYGSKECLDFVKKLYKAKAKTELLASAKLGVEKGSFPLFDAEKYYSSYWWENLGLDPEDKAEIMAYNAMRNSHRGMNAPNGNSGIYAGCVTGGMEPEFLMEYWRWSIVTDVEKMALINVGFKFPDPLRGEWFETEHLKFTTKGNEQILKGEFQGTQYEVDKSRGLIKATLIRDYGWAFVLANYSNEQIEEMRSKGVFATTEDLTVEDHLNVLKIVAHYTDMNNSKTINIPADYPYEKFEQVYELAWKNNIKGVTTYRAGTALSVLESTTAQQTQPSCAVKETSAPKRPKRLPADVYSIKVKNEKFIVAVGLMQDRPYELFCGAMNGLDFKFKERKGFIEKIKRGHYKLDLDDIEIENFTEHFKEVEKTVFRMVSTSLRHGVPIKFIVDQLTKSDDDMFSLTAAATRVLKKYIKDGEKASGINCPNCGAVPVYTEGCVTCPSCGWSKCN